MKSNRIVLGLLVAAIGFPCGAWTVAADRRGAERMYKSARRLVAERSPDAAAALAKVYELDPEGPLADDASIESALLIGAAGWPIELGRVTSADAKQVRQFLERVTQGMPDADRATEAGYYLALQLLEPFAGRDESSARLALIGLSDTAPDGEWSSRSRYTRAWIDEHRGQYESAAAAYQRLAIDVSNREVALRSNVGLARIALHGGKFDEAALRFDQAARDGVPDAFSAVPLRELAVRVMFGGLPGQSGESEILAAGTGIRSIAGWIARDDGGVVMADRRSGEIHRYRSDGSVAAHWNLPGLQGVAADPRGNLYAAAGGAFYRIRAGQSPVGFATYEAFGSISSIAVDAVGRLYILDKRGTAVATVEPGAGAPGATWESLAAKVFGLVWDRGRLLAIDSRGNRVVALRSNGDAITVVDGLDKPESISVDRAGRLAVAEAKNGQVSFYSREGQLIGSWLGRNAGVLRPEAVSFAGDGTLQVFDAANQTWVRVP